ncbi:AEC family transporter [Ectobacillus sp. JY-23]|uniref:AEC family transporter n=1 Tax=Ectobacillus sp. JY-23 TaxID=2933872 RepID=UPI001FF691E3|nr:AEC family transporter [Ectobacillus sp. JY-23]UOY92786.1 AEC family transporter [Ectobacillus sp. JY-23]
MNQFIPLVEQLITLYVIAGVGFVLKRRNVLTQASDHVMMQIVLLITLPALIVSSLDTHFAFTLLSHFFWLIGMSAFALLTAVLIGKLLSNICKLHSKCRSGFEGISVFGNQGFIGYAVCGYILGAEGIIYTIIFNILYLFLIWTYGIHLFNKDHAISRTEIFLNAGVLSTCIGLLLFLTPLSLPAVILQPLQNIGAMTTPLSLLAIGSLLGSLSLRSAVTISASPYIWIAAFTKLLLVPLLLFAFIPFTPNFSVIAAAVLLAGMPSAPTMSLYALKYGGDAEFTSVGVGISTVLSIGTLPFIYILLTLFFS